MSQAAAARSIRQRVLVGTFGLSVIVAGLVVSMHPDQNLRIVRLEQVYGFIALLYWYAALMVSPVQPMLPVSWAHKALNARRAIGVGSAYFALLHSGLAFFGQLEGFSGVQFYTSLFAQAILLGAGALVALVLMAATSTDKAVALMGLKYWKYLHRLGYAASVAVLWHVWIIGSHIDELFVRVTIYVLVSILVVLEAQRVWRVRQQASLAVKIAVALVFLALVSSALAVAFLAPTQHTHSYHLRQADV